MKQKCDLGILAKTGILTEFSVNLSFQMQGDLKENSISENHLALDCLNWQGVRKRANDKCLWPKKYIITTWSSCFNNLSQTAGLCQLQKKKIATNQLINIWSTKLSFHRRTFSWILGGSPKKIDFHKCIY